MSQRKSTSLAHLLISNSPSPLLASAAANRTASPDARFVCDPATFVADAKEPRLLVPRQVDSPPPYYKVLPEGLIHDWDGSDNIRSAGTSDIDGGLQGDKNPRTWDGVDFNRQWVTNWDEGQNGSGDFPFSEIEMRHLITFIHSHPKIYGIMGCKIALLLLICAQGFSLI